MKTPRWIWIAWVALIGCGWQLNGQTYIDLTRQGRLGSGTTLPAQCAVGQVFFKSNAPAGANLYTCIAQNSWTAVGLSEGVAANRPADCTFGQIWLSTDTGAMTYCSGTGNPGTWSPTLAGAGQIATYGTPLTVRPTLNFGAGATCVDNSGSNRTDCTFGGGGGGSSVVLTSGAGSPSASCAAPSSSNLAVYLDTTNQDEWWCSATNSWKKILSVTGSGPYLVTGGTGAAPGNPASGTVSCYFSSATNTQICLGSGGNATTMVPVPALPTGTSITLTGISGIANCTGNCTVTVPAPSPGVVFCAVTDDNVSASITFAPLGSGGSYESATHTGYGTAGTGTLSATAAVGNRACILGRDATHYLTYSATGTWTVN